MCVLLFLKALIHLLKRQITQTDVLNNSQSVMCHYERRHSIYMYVGTLAYTHPPCLAWWCTYIRPSESSEYNRFSEYCTHAYTTCTEAVPTTGIKKKLFALNHYMCSSEQSPYMTYYAPSSGVVTFLIKAWETTGQSSTLTSKKTGTLDHRKLIKDEIAVQRRTMRTDKKKIQEQRSSCLSSLFCAASYFIMSY